MQNFTEIIIEWQLVIRLRCEIPLRTHAPICNTHNKSRKTMKQILSLILILNVLLSSFGQESVTVKPKRFDDYNSIIPIVSDTLNNNSSIVKRINSRIEEDLMLTSESAFGDEFKWYDLTYNWEKDRKYLCFDFQGEYIGGPYPNYNEFSMIFDLQNGDYIDVKKIDLASIFTLTGYYQFFEKYCLSPIKKEFETAFACSEGSEPYCSYYDLELNINKKEIEISLTGDCFPHVLKACSPYFSVGIPADTLKPFLNDFGKLLIDRFETDDYSTLKEHRFLQENKELIPNYFFLVGKIGGKYPFKMAIQFDYDQNKAKGYYYYDKNKVELELDGSATLTKINLIEVFNGKQTGIFEFEWSNNYTTAGYLINDRYLTGVWHNPDKTKKYNIEITNVKMK